MDANEPQVNQAKTSQDYVDAINRVIDLAQMGVRLVPGAKGKAVAAAVNKAAPYVRQAAEFAPHVIPKVAPVIEEKVAPAVQKAAAGVAHAVPQAGHAAASRVGAVAHGIGSGVAGAIGGVGANVHALGEARAQAKARTAAREAILNGSEIRMSVEKFMQSWMGNGGAPAGTTSFLDHCGCYVMATYPHAVKKGDFTCFRDIYVGKSYSMGASAFADATGAGSPEVYADVKFKQHVYVLFYPCERENLDELESSLIYALDANESYNR
jgi:hypothetical protein